MIYNGIFQRLYQQLIFLELMACLLLQHGNKKKITPSNILLALLCFRKYLSGVKSVLVSAVARGLELDLYAT